MIENRRSFGRAKRFFGRTSEHFFSDLPCDRSSKYNWAAKYLNTNYIKNTIENKIPKKLQIKKPKRTFSFEQNIRSSIDNWTTYSNIAFWEVWMCDFVCSLSR